ncbi:MAG: NACHT domain-containing protein [Symploca sp. SIO1C2]|nr:NACHT domain-containing protein [Symploca sp. SIO1C2]
MVEPLTTLGVSVLGSLVLKEILPELGKGALEDYVKDFFKDFIKGKIPSANNSVLQQALGKTLQQFVKLIELELEYKCDLSGAEIRDNYQVRIKGFLKNEQVKSLLGSAFGYDYHEINGKQLALIWRQHYPPAMPAGFNWHRVATKYVEVVKDLIKQLPELREILELETLQVVAEQTQAIAGIPTDFNLAAYQEGLKERYANLNLDSLDASVYDYREKLKVWQVFVPQYVRQCQEFLPQVYEIPKEHQRQLRQSDQLEAEVDPAAWERYKEIYYQQPIRQILEVVSEIWSDDSYRYLVILGDPGSGKSMLLQYLALNWARSPLDNAIELRIPLLIELRTYILDRNTGGCKDLLDFLDKGNVICRLNPHRLQERLKAGKVLVMFDGLDEVFEPRQREKVITDIHRFTNEYPKVRVIVTSRIIGYKPQRLRDAEFRHFLLQDLDSRQIQDFIHRWHQLTFTDEADKLRKRERLQRAIDTSKAIRELAENPLLLTMMAILNRNQELPRDRPELYLQASRVLLHQWDVEQKLLADPQLNAVTIDYKDKQAMLRQIAYFMQGADKGLAGNLIRGNNLEGLLFDYIESLKVGNARTIARLLIEQLRSRNFILCFLGGDVYAFVHRTFLEYFCAWEYVWQFQQTQTLSIEQLKTEVFGKHWQDESWQEVLQLIAGMIDAKFVGQIIEYLIEQKIDKRDFLDKYRRLKAEGVKKLLLAANCLGEVRNKNAIVPISTRLQALLIKELEQEYPYKFDAEAASVIVNAIATVWQDAPQMLKWLKSCVQLDNLSSFIPESAVKAIAQHWKDDPDTLPLLKQWAQSDNNSNVRQAAVRELAKGWKDEPDTLPLIQQRAQSDDNWLVRQAAVQEIARGWKDEPDTLPLLKQWVQFDKYRVVQYAAVEALAKGWKDDPETLTLIKQRAQSNKHSGARRAAVEALAKGWKDDPETLPLLKQRAQSDEDMWVRRAAVEALAKDWKDDPETLALIKQQVQSDEDSWVRRAAVEALAKGWKDDPETLALIKQQVQSDEDSWVRRAAVEALANGWRDKPDTLPLLKQWVQSHENIEVRQAAVEEIARGWKDEPDTLPLLKQWAQSHENIEVRQAAVEEIARGWKDKPDTLPLLKQWTQSDKDWAVQRAAVRELAKGWKDDSETLTLIKQRAQSDNNSNVRRAAVEALAKGWKNDPKTLTLIKQWAQSDENSDVRCAAVRELAKVWKDDPDTLTLIKQRAQSDENSNVRCVAVEEIARGWKDEPDTLPLLKQRIQLKEHPYVLEAAVEEIARGWKDEPDTLPWLKQRIQLKEYWFVRGTAIQELAKGWKNEPETLPLVKFYAQYDNHWLVRGVAMTTLAERWKDDPDTLPLLQQCAQSDDNKFVRREAVQQLAKGWKDNPEIVNWLKNLAVTDNSLDIEQATIEELTKDWTETQQAIPWFKSLAQLDDDWFMRQLAIEYLAQNWQDEPWMLEFLSDRVLNDPFKRQSKWEDNPRQVALELIIKHYPNHPDILPLLQDRAENDSDEKMRKFAKRNLDFRF